MPFCILFCCVLAASFKVNAQEICDNGLDDDQNGLIDLNDPSCICESYLASSLIPNPSFEEMNCCPDDDEMLHCAESWIQASAATSDYVHTCEGYLGNLSIPAFAPLPFADGDGAVGLRDGVQLPFAPGGENYKEYTGACLAESMEIGVSYRLDFYVGFQEDVPGSSSFEIAIFGSTSCSAIPFGGGNINIGCPLNAGGFTVLAEQTVSGNGEWVNVSLEFEAAQAYAAIVIGPSCAVNPNYQLQPYFFVDRLALEKEAEFGFPLNPVSGGICTDDLLLGVPSESGQSYQWYKDGVALVGETNSALLLVSGPGVEGSYQLVISNEEGCSLSQDYDLFLPPYYSDLSLSICEGEALEIEGQTYQTTGYFEQTLMASDGCDSVLRFDLQVLERSYSLLEDNMCEGDSQLFFGTEISEPGSYFQQLTNVSGCDSIIELRLGWHPGSNAIDLPESLTLDLGEDAVIEPLFVDQNLQELYWYDLNGQLLNEGAQLEFTAIDSTVFYLHGTDQNDCWHLDSVEVIVDKSNRQLLIPTAFSPDGNQINDRFRFLYNRSLREIEGFYIFDRWGKLLYEQEGISGQADFLGWDGRFAGEEMPMGVYCFLLEAVFLDGYKVQYQGNVTLVR